MAMRSRALPSCLSALPGFETRACENTRACEKVASDLGLAGRRVVQFPPAVTTG